MLGVLGCRDRSYPPKNVLLPKQRIARDVLLPLDRVAAQARHVLEERKAGKMPPTVIEGIEW